jgi:hypothetical protein
MLSCVRLLRTYGCVGIGIGCGVVLYKMDSYKPNFYDVCPQIIPDAPIKPNVVQKHSSERLLDVCVEPERSSGRLSGARASCVVPEHTHKNLHKSSSTKIRGISHKYNDFGQKIYYRENWRGKKVRTSKAAVKRKKRRRN